MDEDDFQVEPARKKLKCLPCSTYDLPTFVERRHKASHCKTRKHRACKERHDAAPARQPLRLLPVNDLSDLSDDDRAGAVMDFGGSDLGEEFSIPMPMDLREEGQFWQEASRPDEDNDLAQHIAEEIEQVNEGLDAMLRAAMDGVQALAQDEPSGWFPFNSKATLLGAIFWMSPRHAISKTVLSLALSLATSFGGNAPSMYAEICENPFVVYDCQLKEEVVIRPFLLAVFCDNPMAAEMTASIGLNGLQFCRLCDATVVGADTADGFEQYLSPGEPRTTDQTLTTLRDLLDKAATGVKARVDELRKESGVKDGRCEAGITKLLEVARIGSPAVIDQLKQTILTGEWHGPLFKLHGGFSPSRISTPFLP
ncbi:unnamed protein product [Tilletia caries]|nr:unnamed protein product [Tilletia caries]